MNEETRARLKELYAAKGEIVTQLENWQGRLSQVNQAINLILNQPFSPANSPKKVDEPVETEDAENTKEP